MIITDDIAAVQSITTSAKTISMRSPAGRPSGKNTVVVLWWLTHASNTPSTPTWRFGGSGGTAMTTRTVTFGETAKARVGVSYITGVTPTNPVDIYKASHTTGTGYCYVECVANADIDSYNAFESSSTATEQQRTLARRGGNAYTVVGIGDTGFTVSAYFPTDYKENSIPDQRDSSFRFAFILQKNAQANATAARYFGGIWSGTKSYICASVVLDNAGFDEHPIFL